MAKSLQRIEAEKLRTEGKSVKEIAKTLKVSRGSVSLWTRDIILTEEQISHLHENMKKGSAVGRAKSMLIHKESREKIKADSERFGVEKLSGLTDREFLVAGLAIF